MKKRKSKFQEEIEKDNKRLNEIYENILKDEPFKEKSTKEKILKALEDKPKRKVVKWKSTQKQCDELNEMAKKLGLDKFPDWKPHKPREFEVIIG